MEIANLVLEYLKVLLNWPLLVFVLAWMFKKPLSELLRKIKKIGFPGGLLDAEADEASSEADEITSVTPPLAEQAEAAAEAKGPEPAEPQEQRPAAPVVSVPAAKESTETRVPESTEDDALVDIELGVASSLAGRTRETALRRNSVDEGQYYESFRQLAVDSPVAAVREAHQRVRLIGRRLLQDVRPGWRVSARSLHEIFQALSDEKLITPDATEPARRLDRIYHSPDSSELSAKGALSFVGAAQKLDYLLTEARMRFESKLVLRMAKAHPAVKGLIASFGFEEPEVRTTLSTKGITLVFSALTTEIGNEPRYEALVQSLADLAKAEGIVIRVHHPDQGRILR